MWGNLSRSKEIVKGFPVTVEADFVHSCTLKYSHSSTCLYFATKTGNHGRVTFKDLSAVRVSEGDHNPYYDHAMEDEHSWVFTIENSVWLNDRYHYEKKFHKDSYPDRKSIHDILDRYHHFYFWFHDQFVEAIAQDILVEESERAFPEN